MGEVDFKIVKGTPYDDHLIYDKSPELNNSTQANCGQLKFHPLFLDRNWTTLAIKVFTFRYDQNSYFPSRNQRVLTSNPIVYTFK